MQKANRTRRPIQSSFVAGGVYNANNANNATNSKAKPQQDVAAVVPKIEETTPQKLNTPEIQPMDAQQPILETTKLSENSEIEGLTDENGKPRFKKIFLTRKKSSIRVKEKRIRQNRKLRKTITPKNALMALNELKGVNIGDFVINNHPSGGFGAIVTVNNFQYEGKGSSKMAAKTNACEKALRDYVLHKMKQNPRVAKVTANDELMDTSEVDENLDDSDDVPMVNLASFALYKLFTEWENEGFDIPELHPAAATINSGSESSIPKDAKKVFVRNELPPNWETMHPATLLCMMRPGLTYTDMGTVGEIPNVMQKIGCIVDEQEFIGFGRSKKGARRNCAVDVCNTLFGTNFTKEKS